MYKNNVTFLHGARYISALKVFSDDECVTFKVAIFHNI